MANVEKIPVDYNGLRRAVKMRGLKMSKVGEDLGYSHTYIFHIGEQGYIRKPMAVALERLYGIKPEEYKPKEEKEQKMEPKKDITGSTLPQQELDELVKMSMMLARYKCKMKGVNYDDYIKNLVWKDMKEEVRKLLGSMAES